MYSKKNMYLIYLFLFMALIIIIKYKLKQQQYQGRPVSMLQISYFTKHNTTQINYLIGIFYYNYMMIEQKSQKIFPSSLLQVTLQTNQNKISANSSFLTSNFFDVTINSQKLSHLFKNIEDIISEQNAVIGQLSKDIRNVQYSLKQKIQDESKKNGLLFTKLDMKISDSTNNNYCCIMDVHKKAQNRDEEMTKCIQRRLQSLNSKIGRVQDSAIDDLKNGLDNLKKQIIGGLQIQIQSENQPNNKKIDFSYLFEYFTAQLKKVKQTIIPTFDQLYDSKELQKKKKHTQNMIDLTYKKQQIENNTVFKQNIGFGFQQNFNKVIYSTGKKTINLDQKNKQKQKQLQEINHHIRIFNKAKRHFSFNQATGAQEQILNNFQQTFHRVQRLQQIANEHNQAFTQLKNKQIVLDEKVCIMNRKLQKNCYESAQLKTNIRKVQSQRIDEKIIDQLRNYMKWAVRDLQEKINFKCSDEDLNRQKVKLVQKISILHQNLIEKADKGQIQKALVFLENKIKQIILLIAAQQSQEKQGAIMKVAAKCLSCDKQVQRQLKQQVSCKRDLQKLSQGQYIKSMTHRVRQRYKKQTAQTLGNQTFND